MEEYSSQQQGEVQQIASDAVSVDNARHRFVGMIDAAIENKTWPESLVSKYESSIDGIVLNFSLSTVYGVILASYSHAFKDDQHIGVFSFDFLVPRLNGGHVARHLRKILFNTDGVASWSENSDFSWEYIQRDRPPLVNARKLLFTLLGDVQAGLPRY